MTVEEFVNHARQALGSNSEQLSLPVKAEEFAPVATLVNELLLDRQKILRQHQDATGYIRKKVNQLLEVIGTIPLRPEELDDNTIIVTDPIGIVAEAFRQILEHQRSTNRKLEAAVGEIQAIFEAVGGGILVVDPEMRIQSYNANFKEMFLQPQDHPIGIRCSEVLCKDWKQSDCCPFQDAIKNTSSVSVADWRIKKRHYHIVATPIVSQADKSVKGLVLLYMDITARKQAEAALAAEKERLAVTLTSIAEGVITTDIEGRIVLMNRLAEKLTGWRQNEAQDKSVCEVFWIVEETDRRSCIDFPQEILSSGKKIERTSNTILISEDGTEHLITLSVAPITSTDKKIIGVVIVFRDITAEKKQEAELLNARKIQSLGILAGGIAHDFNNLLTAIIGNISLARMYSEPDSKARDCLSQAEKAIARAKSLTQQLLTFSKGGTPRRHIVSIKELLRETCIFVLRGSNIKCTFRIADPLWPTNVDEDQISQVVNNLVINALQSMPGGGEFTIIAENISLEQAEGLPLTIGPYIKVMFVDNGTGISPEIIDKIFDPYFTTKTTGSGLGLATSYAIIRKHGGALTVDSTPGHGAIFTFFLPAEPNLLPVAENAEESAVSEMLGAAKVLIMDDEEMIRDITLNLLVDQGFKVVTVGNGQEALNSYQAAIESGEPFDLVILDLTIPGGMGGMETFEQLQKLDPAVRAIVSSGYSEDEILANYQRYGFKGMLAKPYPLEDLLQIVRQVLVTKNN